ncbi:50S ribosomal protein L3 [candidate division KSB1 bacterium]|nr:MAG: 50S ribosomal protein L3 [candidate division KSB1 bacterium]
MSGILGKKIGMTRFFEESGRSVPATLIEAGPCPVVQIKTKDKDGYSAVQLGFIEQKIKRVNKPKLGHFKKTEIPPHRVLREFRDFKLDVKEGDKISVDIFTVGQKVKITGISKGGGFAGVVKRHGFSGGPKSHGQSDRLRAPGSIGQSATPKRVLKGLKMAGRRGGNRITVNNLEILKVIPDRNLLLVKGGVPGARNSILEIRN